MEVVIRSQWQPGEGVTQLAAHSTADGKSMSQFWQAEDVGSIRTTAGLPISMAEFDNRRTITHVFCMFAVHRRHLSGKEREQVAVEAAASNLNLVYRQKMTDIRRVTPRWKSEHMPHAKDYKGRRV